MSYTLFCAPNTYAMIAHALLEEIGVEYSIRWVELFSSEPDPEFLAASPHARVPALTGPDGAMCETAAIATYLAERHAPDLIIAPGHPERGRFLQWLHYLASTLQPDVLIQYHPEFYFEDSADQDRLKAASRNRLTQVLDIIEEALGEGPYFFGTQLTVCDYCLALQTIWPPMFPGSIADYPSIERLTKLVTHRPAVDRILAIHGIS